MILHSHDIALLSILDLLQRAGPPETCFPGPHCFLIRSDRREPQQVTGQSTALAQLLRCCVNGPCRLGKNVQRSMRGAWGQCTGPNRRSQRTRYEAPLVSQRKSVLARSPRPTWSFVAWTPEKMMPPLVRTHLRGIAFLFFSVNWVRSYSPFPSVAVPDQ